MNELTTPSSNVPATVSQEVVVIDTRSHKKSRIDFGPQEHLAIEFDGVETPENKETEDKYPHVPQQHEFSGDDGYIDANDLGDLADVLIKRHPVLFGHLTNVHIDYLWKKKGGKSKGQFIYGKTQKVPPLLGHYTSYDYIITLSADYLYGATSKNVEAVLFHELCHVQFNDDEEEQEVALVGHDVEGFVEEVKIYGAWRKSLRQFVKACQQLPLL